MACNPEVLKHVPLFALLDEEESAVLAGQVELKKFAPRQRIYKIGDPGERAYVMVSGSVRVTTVDEDHQEVIVDQPAYGEFFGFASMLEQTPHQTNATAVEETVCIEVDRNDISVLLQRKPLAGMDMLTVLGRQFHAAQQLVRVRASRNPNEMIEQEATPGERIADRVAGFGGSWSFILTFLSVLVVYTAVNLGLRRSAWDPYPFILLNLAFSTQAAYAAPLILLAQTRQADRDKAHAEADAEHREDIARANMQRQTLITNQTAILVDMLNQNTQLTESIKELTERLETLTLEVHKKLACPMAVRHMDTLSRLALHYFRPYHWLFLFHDPFNSFILFI